ncbi:hypothetical protein LZ554_009082 [Drepanopeziza brunnea f. sp. 'monogermtubi']|nr:hypothetical protein LZ554_009082 [Drepanopeziza brunnea f. sp. 'monogermtubi']
MLRSSLWRNVTTARISNRIPPQSPFRRYATQEHQAHQPRLHPVRILGPTLWAFAASGSIYLGCAAYEVYQDVQQFKGQVGTVSYNSIDATRQIQGVLQSAATSRFSVSDIFTTPWARLNSAEAMLVTTGGLNFAAFGLQRLSSSTFMFFAHVPMYARNFTLLTSMFGHSGSLHIGFNMLALSSFGPALAATATFQSSGAHLAAFYLTGGLLASLAHHISCASPIARMAAGRMSPGLGASGAIYAMVAAYVLSYPNVKIGIMFVPVPAVPALWSLVAFETWGTFFGCGFVYLEYLPT